MTDQPSAAQECRIHLLDVGRDEYGDAVLCQFGKRVVLIDGAHPGDNDGTPGHHSIPDQIAQLTGTEKPYPIDLLIVTHAHQDHIGCLPRLVSDGLIKVGWLLSVDPRLGWGRSLETDALWRDADPIVLKLAAALREEIRTERGTPDSALDQFLTDAANLETTYKKMLDTLESGGTNVVKFGNPGADMDGLLAEFSDIGLKILGPGTAHLLECANEIGKKTTDSVKMADSFIKRDASSNAVQMYRQAAAMISENENTTDATGGGARPGNFINLQSLVTQFECAGHKFLFAGDFQFNKPQTKNSVITSEVETIKNKIKAEAPYSFVKLSHHGSDNAFSEEMLTDLGDTEYFGVCAGEQSSKHPNQIVLKLLEKHKDDIKWARTDHNGLVSLTFAKDKKEPEIKIEKGVLNDPKPNFIDVTSSISPTIMPSTEVFPLAEIAANIGEEAGEKASSIETAAVAGQNKVQGKLTGEKENDYIEITARIPHRNAEMSFSGNFTFKVNTDFNTAAENETEKKDENPVNSRLDDDPTFLNRRRARDDARFIVRHQRGKTRRKHWSGGNQTNPERL